MFESKAGVLWIAGLGFFIFAFISNGLVPILMYENMPERQLAQLVNPNVVYSGEDLARRYPEQFKKYVGEASKEKYAELLSEGRKIYVGEACWHCHSQFVRPVANESKRFGPVARTEEYQNVLQRPVMFGTRRVGPDLSREGGRRGSDWHAQHFWKPKSVSTDSPMPNYPWFFDDNDPSKPNKRGLAIIMYVQWLGSWLESYPLYEAYQPKDDPGGQLPATTALPPVTTPAPAAEKPGDPEKAGEEKPAATANEKPAEAANPAADKPAEPTTKPNEE